MDCLRYICQELPYEFIDMKRASYNNYLKFFEAQKAGQKVEKTLSFKEMIDIINEDNIEENMSRGKSYAGGYSVC